MKKLLSLEEIKKIEFEILKHFKEFCETEHIRFFLSNGTLLGAIKYGGFIPWDDDIDVFVPREDYNRLIQCYKDSEKYCLYSFERNSKFYYPFAKLCDSTTIKEEKNINNGVLLGLDIDIFPLDVWPNSETKRKKMLKSIQKSIRGLTYAKLRFNKGKTFFRSLVKNILIALYKVMGAKFFIRQIVKKVREARTMEKSNFVGCVSWPIYGEREIVSQDIFSNYIEVEFNGVKFPAPVGYAKYLKSLYGAYENDLPKEKQKTHHNYKAYSYWEN